MNPHAEQLRRLIEHYKLDCRYPSELEGIMRLLEHDRMRPAFAQKFIRKIQPRIKKQIEEGNYLPMPPTKEDFKLDAEPFDAVLGNLVERPEVPFGIHLSNGVHHVLIFGKPDAGKSVTLRYYFLKVHEHGILHPDQKAVIIFLDSKRDAPNPEKLFGDDAVHFSVHHPDKWRAGLNGPPGVPWAGHVSMVLASRMQLIFSRGCLRTEYNWILPILNPHPTPGQPLIAPSVRLLRDVLANSPPYCWGEKAEYVNTLTQALSTLLVDGEGLLDAENGFDANAVIAQGKHCVIDIANLEPPYLRYIICDLIILQILLYRIHHHLKTKRTEVCITWDEGDMFALPSAQAVYPQSLSPITLLARLAREYGLQICLSVSALQNVAPYLLSGAECTIAMGCVDPMSISCAQSALGLERGTERMLLRLRPGQAIVRLADTPYPYPFLGQVHYIEPDHSAKGRPYDAIPWTKARGLDELPEVQQALEERIRQFSKARMRRTNAAAVVLTKIERALLDYMSLREYEPLSVVFSCMGDVPAGTQTKVVAKLVRKKLIEADTVRLSKSAVRFGAITAQGWQYLGKMSRLPPLRGGIVHTSLCYGKRRLDRKNGCEESFCEHRLAGCTGFGDVVSFRNGACHVTEVVVDCVTNIVEHARDCFLRSTTPVATLTIVTLLKSEHERIREILRSASDLAAHLDRIAFTTAEEILKGLYK